MTIDSEKPFDNLPLEVYEHIIKYLAIVDLIQLRCVSKKFNYIVSTIKIKEMIFYNSLIEEQNIGSRNYKFNWFAINQAADFKNSISSSKLFLLNRNLFNLDLLKYLLISQEVHKNTQLESAIINKFNRLEVLELDLIIFETMNFDLNLPNLKSFDVFVKAYRDSEVTFKINAPELQALKFNPTVELEFFNSTENSIKYAYLNYQYVSRRSSYRQIIKSFKNLECLEINGDYYPSLFDLVSLNGSANLKKLKFRHTSNWLSRVISLPYQAVNAFIVKYPEVEMYFFDFFITSIAEMRRLKCRQVDMAKCIENQSILDENPIDQVVDIDNYNVFMNSVVKLPNHQNFLEKFNNIREITVKGKVDNLDRLMNFIYNCKNLINLVFESTSLGQSFYDELPAISALSKLKIVEQEINLSFDFVRRMFYLDEFETNQQAPIELFATMRSYSSTFLLKTDKHPLIRLTRLDKNSFKVDDDEQIGAISLDGLKKWFQIMKGRYTNVITRSALKRLKSDLKNEVEIGPVKRQRTK